MSRLKLRRRPPADAAKAFERALRRRGCDECGSRKTVLRQRSEVSDVTLVHAEGCTRRLDPFGGDSLAAAAAKTARLRYMASDGGGGGIVQDCQSPLSGSS
jgi:transcriptional regulator NrdR family protein